MKPNEVKSPIQNCLDWLLFWRVGIITSTFYALTDDNVGKGFSYMRESGKVKRQGRGKGHRESRFRKETPGLCLYAGALVVIIAERMRI